MHSRNEENTIFLKIFLKSFLRVDIFELRLGCILCPTYFQNTASSIETLSFNFYQSLITKFFGILGFLSHMVPLSPCFKGMNKENRIRKAARKMT